nr:phosphoglycerol transferase I [Klebsiella pneumoniae]
MERYKGNVDTLKIVDNDIRYKADSFVFNVAGARKRLNSSAVFRVPSRGAVVQCSVGQRRED